MIIRPAFEAIEDCLDDWQSRSSLTNGSNGKTYDDAPTFARNWGTGMSRKPKFRTGQVVACAINREGITRFVRIESFDTWKECAGALVMASDTKCEWIPLMNLRPLTKRERGAN
jgi:hypothetical protein